MERRRHPIQRVRPGSGCQGARSQCTLAHDFVSNAEDRKLFDAVSRPNAITRAYAMGPGVPPERVAAIEKAFLDSFKDPALLEEAKKGDFDVAPQGGKFVADRVKAILETEPAVLQRMKELIPTG